MARYLILDYCPGGELFTQIGRHSRFSERRTRFYTVRAVTLGLGCCAKMCMLLSV